MFTLLSEVRALLFRRDEYNVLILGLDNAGKTTFLEKLKALRGLAHEEVSKIVPTVGQNVGRFAVGGARYNFWDLGGQEALRSLWTRYLEDTHLICFVVDAADPERLGEAVGALEHVGTEIQNMPLLVLANKQDLEGAVEIGEIKDTVNQVLQRIDPKEGGVLGCSAAEGRGLEEALAWMTSRTTRNKRERPPKTG
ncbi:ADP-ribosylation factor protein 1 [Savitreella phatthalungensis]